MGTYKTSLPPSVPEKALVALVQLNPSLEYTIEIEAVPGVPTAIHLPKDPVMEVEATVPLVLTVQVVLKPVIVTAGVTV